MRWRDTIARGRFWPVLLLLAVACGGPAPEEPVVAEVGDQVISAREFMLDYEFGLPVLKRGSDPVRGYLQAMIGERMLSAEAYRRGLDQTPEVQAQVAALREELLVGQVFDHEVHDRVAVTPAEIDSIRFSEQVSFQLRFVPAASSDQALRLREIYESGGHAAAVRQLAAMEEGLTSLDADELQTGYLTRHDLAPTVRAALDNLPVGQVSDPIAHRGSYLLVEVVDIQRAAVSEQASAEEQERYREVAFQTKARRAARAFVKETMQDSGLRLKGDAYLLLEEELWQVLSGDPAGEGSLLARVQGSQAQKLKAGLDMVVMETGGGSWTIRQFLASYPVERYPISTRTDREYRGDLYDAFGLLLRDREFIAMGEQRGYGRLPEVLEELARWEQKWTYRALVDAIRAEVEVTDEQVRDYFRRHRSFWPEDAALRDVQQDVRSRVVDAVVRTELNRLADSLSAVTPVTIHEDVLAELDLAPRSAPLSLFRSSTGRPAWPVLEYGL